MSCLFSAEIESIHKYVVTSNKMWTIRAGSYILDKFNKDIAKEFAEKRVLNGTIIYSSGGAVKAIFNDRNSAENYGKEIARQLRKETEIASLTWAAEEIKNDKIGDALKSVESKIQENKSKKLEAVSVVNNPLFIDCEICKKYPAEKKIHRQTKVYLVCRSCKLKEANGEAVLDIYKKINEERQLFNDFEELVKQDKQDYLALVSSDGNRMGEHLIELSKEKNPADLLKNFSDKLNEATTEAFKEAVNQTFEKYFEKDKNHFPFMVIVLGGDDLSVVMPARFAFDFVKVFTEEFTNRTKKFKDNNLPEVSISTGIAVAKHTFPFYNLMEVAEDLQKNAKKLSRALRKTDGSKEYSTVDFEIITEALSEEISERRKALDFKTYPEGYLATGRPYLIGEGNYPFKFEELLSLVKKLKEAAVSNSFLNDLYKIVNDPQTMRIEMALKLKKLSKETREIPGLSNYTQGKNNFDGKKALPVLDIAEIYDFIGG